MSFKQFKHWIDVDTFVNIQVCNHANVCEDEKNQLVGYANEKDQVLYANVKVNVITDANVKHACKCLTLMLFCIHVRIPLGLHNFEFSTHLQLLSQVHTLSY